MLARLLALAVLLAGISGLWGARPAQAGTFDCGPGGALCSWSIEINGSLEAEGLYRVDQETGDISFSGSSTMVELSDGTTAGIMSLSGNADPIIGFSVAGGTGTTGSTFVFHFQLPITLAGPIFADSSVSYSLTSLTSAGAQISPFLFPNVVRGNEVDTSIGGLGTLNKGVDVGDAFFFTGGPQTQNSPVYTASNSFLGDLAYDLMTATVAFSLTPNSQVGASGFVQQVVVPEPMALTLIAMSLGFVAVGRGRLLSKS